MPPDGRDTASALMYQNFEAMSQSVSSVAADVVNTDVRESLRQATLFQSALPRVVFVYGEQDRILGSAKGSFGIRMASMLGLGHLMDASGMGGLLHH